jgi:hypothetical protein
MKDGDEGSHDSTKVEDEEAALSKMELASGPWMEGIESFPLLPPIVPNNNPSNICRLLHKPPLTLYS